MGKLRRGFKSETNALVSSVRAELGLDPCAVFDVWRLAQLLEIPLVALSSYRNACPEAVEHFRSVETGAFSAVTVFDGRRRLIVYNDAHARTRQASDLAHELAHALLQHPPHAAMDERGCRVWPVVLEEEANWLGPVLLVPDSVALSVAHQGLSVTEAARQYCVSPQLMRFRVNMTAAQKRVAYRRT